MSIPRLLKDLAGKGRVVSRSGHKEHGTARDTLDLPFLHQLVQITAGIGSIDFRDFCNFLGTKSHMATPAALPHWLLRA
jgi:hypothetical protein